MSDTTKVLQCLSWLPDQLFGLNMAQIPPTPPSRWTIAPVTVDVNQYVNLRLTLPLLGSDLLQFKLLDADAE